MRPAAADPLRHNTLYFILYPQRQTLSGPASEIHSEISKRLRAEQRDADLLTAPTACHASHSSPVATRSAATAKSLRRLDETVDAELGGGAANGTNGFDRRATL